jgi:DNA (cytosine-5)-methyltransferase 1
MKALSLFASGGISELHLDKLKSKIEIKLANELLKDRCNFYSQCHSNEIICGNICDSNIFNEIINKSKILDIDMIIATPPCQGMSKAGKMKVDDPRNILFIKIIEIIEILKPKYILIENVPEFLNASFLTLTNEKKIMDEIKDQLQTLYNIESKILNTQNYGIAQSRKRAIILLSRVDCKLWKHPLALNDNDHLITVNNIIGNLITLESNEKCKDKMNISNQEFNQNMLDWHNALKHNDQHILWMKHTPSGKSAFDNEFYYPQKDNRRIKGYKTTYKRIDWNKPCPTITMSSGSISSQNNVHPGRKLNDNTYSDARTLTVYELMLLSSIDPKFIVPKNTTDKLFRQLLGECVPPLFMFHLLSSLP